MFIEKSNLIIITAIESWINLRISAAFAKPFVGVYTSLDFFVIVYYTSLWNFFALYKNGLNSL